jgi:hypothetical protein
MGVYYERCAKCDDEYMDFGTFDCSCGRGWCSEECAIEDGAIVTEHTEGWIEVQSCNFCRGEDFSDSDLLVSLMDSYELTRADVIRVHKFLMNK